MLFPLAKTKGVRKLFKDLEKIMVPLGYARCWDYEKLVYDKKYGHEDLDYYLRLPGHVVNEYRLEHPRALLEMETPIWVRHSYPHGADPDSPGLDPNAPIPPALVQRVEADILALEEALRTGVVER